MQALLTQSPRQAGLARSRWWLAGLQAKVEALHTYTLSGIWRLLRRWQLRYKRGRQALHSPDPNYGLKMNYIEAAQQMAYRQPQQFVFLYQDELTYYRRASVARDYAPTGQALPKVPQGLSTNKKRRIAACLNIYTGQVIAQQRHRLHRRNLLHFYRQIDQAYPDAQTIWLVQDNWPVHFHPDILLGLQTTKITLLRLPTYAPWTNPIEKLWLALKRDVLHHHDFLDDWPALQAAVQRWLDQWRNGSVHLLNMLGLYPP